MSSQATLIINAGSRVAASGVGWTNTYATARAEAERWHVVTGVTVRLETHGIDDLAAYQEEHTFPPRIYWNGSSDANPKLEDFAAPGFVPVRTFRR